MILELDGHVFRVSAVAAVKRVKSFSEEFGVGAKLSIVMCGGAVVKLTRYNSTYSPSKQLEAECRAQLEPFRRKLVAAMVQQQSA